MLLENERKKEKERERERGCQSEEISFVVALSSISTHFTYHRRRRGRHPSCFESMFCSVSLRSNARSFSLFSLSSLFFLLSRQEENAFVYWFYVFHRTKRFSKLEKAKKKIVLQKLCFKDTFIDVPLLLRESGCFHATVRVLCVGPLRRDKFGALSQHSFGDFLEIVLSNSDTSSFLPFLNLEAVASTE